MTSVVVSPKDWEPPAQGEHSDALGRFPTGFNGLHLWSSGTSGRVPRSPALRGEESGVRGEHFAAESAHPSPGSQSLAILSPQSWEEGKSKAGRETDAIRWLPWAENSQSFGLKNRCTLNTGVNSAHTSGLGYVARPRS